MKRCLEEIVFSRFYDFFKGNNDTTEVLLNEQLESGFNLASLGIPYTLSVPIIMEQGDSNQAYRVMLVFGFTEEPSSENRSDIRTLAKEFQNTLFEEVFGHHTTLALLRKNNLMAHLGHDLRSPLNNIKAILEEVSAESSDESHRELLLSALENCDDLSTIIADMLDFARFREGNLSEHTRSY